MATEGNVIHYAFIEKFIEKLGEQYHIMEIAFDRWGAVQMVQNLEGMGSVRDVLDLPGASADPGTVGRQPNDGCTGKKRTGRSEREMTTPLFLLRCCEVGISVRDLDLVTIGLVLDIWTEKFNDGVKYRRLADQADFDKF